MNMLMGDDDVPTIDGEEDDYEDEDDEDQRDNSTNNDTMPQYPQTSSPSQQAGPSNVYQYVSPPKNLVARKEPRTKKDPNFWNRDIPDDDTQEPSPRKLRDRSNRKATQDPNFIYSIDDTEFCNANNAAFSVHKMDKSKETSPVNEPFEDIIMDGYSAHWRLDPLDFSHDSHEWDQIFIEPPTKILSGECTASIVVQSIDELIKMLGIEDFNNGEDDHVDAASEISISSFEQRALEAQEIKSIVMEDWDIEGEMPEYAEEDLHQCLVEMVNAESDAKHLEELRKGESLYHGDKVSEWCLNGQVASIHAMPPRVYPYSNIIHLHQGEIWNASEHYGPLIIEVAADLILEQGVAKVLRKEFSDEALTKAFALKKSPGEIINFVTKTRCPGWITLILTRNKMREPTEERWLRESLEKLKMLLTDRPELR
jgi:hypothetical protein